MIYSEQEKTNISKQIDAFFSWMAGNSFSKFADNSSADVPEVVLRRCILCSSEKSLENIAQSYPPCSEERNYLLNKIKEVKHCEKSNYSTAVNAGLDRELTEFLADNYSSESPYELLLSYIFRAGYRKAADFYKDIPDGDDYINADKWYKIKNGKADLSEEQLIIMFYMLRLDYYEANSLFNAFGKTFLPSSKLHIIVLYFLKNGYTVRKEMSYEAGLSLLDETLEKYGMKSIYSIE